MQQNFSTSLEARIALADAKYEWDFSDSDIADARAFARTLITAYQEGNLALASFRFPILLAIVGRTRAKSLLGSYYDLL
jgi:hypothetical protein